MLPKAQDDILKMSCPQPKDILFTVRSKKNKTVWILMQDAAIREFLIFFLK